MADPLICTILSPAAQSRRGTASSRVRKRGMESRAIGQLSVLSADDAIIGKPSDESGKSMMSSDLSLAARSMVKGIPLSTSPSVTPVRKSSNRGFITLPIRVICRRVAGRLARQRRQPRSHLRRTVFRAHPRPIRDGRHDEGEDDVHNDAGGNDGHPLRDALRHVTARIVRSVGIGNGLGGQIAMREGRRVFVGCGTLTSPPRVACEDLALSQRERG